MSDRFDKDDVVKKMEENCRCNAPDTGADVEGSGTPGEFGRVEGANRGGDNAELWEELLEELARCQGISSRQALRTLVRTGNRIAFID